MAKFATTPASNRDESLWRVRDVVARLRVSERTVRRLVEDGTLPVIHIGRRSVRFRPADVRALERSR